MARKLDDWVDGFLEYTKDLPSPELFRKWCAISALAGVMERKIWITTMGRPLYPNLYVILVAPPGVGKTIVTSEVVRLWRKLTDHHVASSSVTKASLIDDLRDASREIVIPSHVPPTIRFNSLLIGSNELGVLIPAYENEFMNVLTDIYDGHGYSERRRTKELQFDLASPQINLLAATTPSYLNNILPEGAWDQGFLSRTLLIYSGLQVLVDPFAAVSTQKELAKDLEIDLKHIGSTFGELRFTQEAKTAITTWHMEGGPPIPDHPKLHNYRTRRTLHLLKLCMVASLSSTDSKEITIDHFARALEWLIEAEHYIPDIFKSMATGGDMKAIEDTWYFAYKMYATKKEPIPEGKIYAYLQARVPAHSVDNIVTLMLRSQLLRETNVNKIGRCFIPMEKGD